MESEKIDVERTNIYGTIDTSYSKVTKDKLKETRLSPVESSGNVTAQYLAAISSTFGALGLGTVLGWLPSVALEGESTYNMKIDHIAIGWIGSLVFLGAATTFAPISFLMENIGRKWALIVLLVPYTIGWLVIIFADSVTMLYVGRFVTGIADGGFCVVTPLYIAEISHKTIRGALGSMFQLMATIGLMFTYIAGSFTSLTTLSVLCLGVPFIFGAIFIFQPESPVYLVRKNRLAEARLALLKLRGYDCDVDHEIGEILDADDLRRSETSTWNVLKRRATQRALIIGCSVMAFQHLCGMYTVMSYSYVIFNSSGIPVSIWNVYILLGFAKLVGLLIGKIVVDQWGRIYLLSMSAIYMCVFLVLIGIYLTLKAHFHVTAIFLYGITPFMAMCGYVIAYSIGFGPIPWIIVGEIFPETVKNTAMNLAVIFNLAAGFLMSNYFLILADFIGVDMIFYLLAAICIGIYAFVKCAMIETKGRTFQAIQNELEFDGISI